MSDTVWLAVIAAVPPTIVALAGLITSIRNGRRIEESKHETQNVARQVQLRNEDIDLMKTGAFRAGHEAGQKQKRDSYFGRMEG